MTSSAPRDSKSGIPRKTFFKDLTPTRFSVILVSAAVPLQVLKNFLAAAAGPEGPARARI